MQLSDFDYTLPPELIAQYPPQVRTDSRLLEVGPAGVSHHGFAEIIELIEPNDVLVVNNTRVVKARLQGVKDTGGSAELLLERLLGEYEGLFQVRVSKPIKPGRTITVGRYELTNAGRSDQFYQLRAQRPMLEILDEMGHVPLPPYIERPDEGPDHERYQTVYSQVPGAVAAPTAGLHFSEALLEAIRAKGAEIAEVTLHVGAGTFQPVRGDIETHTMHSEVYAIDEDAIGKIKAARNHGGRVVAVGTTVVRALESAAANNPKGRLEATIGETQLFIQPGFNFRVVDALITNFHLPRSTLLMLVCAFAGFTPVMGAYQTAVSAGYRFFSYGDAMWLNRSAESGEERSDV